MKNTLRDTASPRAARQYWIPVVVDREDRKPVGQLLLVKLVVLTYR